MGKGSTRRPTQISREEEDLRWAYFQGAISFEEFERRHKQLVTEGKITRSGRKIDA